MHLVEELKTITQKVLAGELVGRDAAEVLEKFTSLNPAEATLVHQLQHYVTDEDLRTGDEEYEAWQKKQVLAALDAVELDRSTR